MQAIVDNRSSGGHVTHLFRFSWFEFRPWDMSFISQLRECSYVENLDPCPIHRTLHRCINRSIIIPCDLASSRQRDRVVTVPTRVPISVSKMPRRYRPKESFQTRMQRKLCVQPLRNAAYCEIFSVFDVLEKLSFDLCSVHVHHPVVSFDLASVPVVAGV